MNGRPLLVNYLVKTSVSKMRSEYNDLLSVTVKN